jgi:hypothetical protein
LNKAIHIERTSDANKPKGRCIILPLGKPHAQRSAKNQKSLPIIFDFDSKKLNLEKSGVRSEFSSFSGLSSSPVSRFVDKKEYDGGFTYSTELVGLLTEFNKTRKEIRLEPMVPWLDLTRIASAES